MKKKLLIVVQHIRRGGIEITAINLVKNLNPEKYDITFYLVNPYNSRQDEQLMQELMHRNVRFICRPKAEKSYPQKYRHLLKIMQEGGYDIVHSHVMFYSGMVMKAAKKAGVPKRVAHSHEIRWNREENLRFKLYKAFMRRWINCNATDVIACCKQAGIYLCGNSAYRSKGKFLPNGIDTDTYAYNLDARIKKRRELSISDHERLVGHIGTIYYIKNQVFLTDIFAEMLKIDPNLKLLLAGEEVERDAVEQKAEKLGVKNKIIFAGQRSDIPELLQAMDIMIFPSLFEALPVALIEAQAAKLPCLISDTITSEVQLNSNLEFMSLQDDAKAWAEKAMELMQCEREQIQTADLRAQYDIKNTIRQLERIYES